MEEAVVVEDALDVVVVLKLVEADDDAEVVDG